MKLTIKEIIISITILLIGLITYSYIQNYNQNKKYNERITNINNKINNLDKTSKGKIIEINYNKFIELFNQDKTNIIFLAGTTCSHCLTTKENLIEVLKENNKIVYYFDVWKITEEEYNNIQTMYSFKGVPNIIVVNNKQIINKLIGQQTFNSLNKFLSNIKD